MDEAYFFDTYAIIEIINGNSNYEKFSKVKVATTIFNIVELNYLLLRDFSQSTADTYTSKYWIFIVDINLHDIKEAMKIKIKNKKLSGADVIGYTVAKRIGIKFLTGDEDFRGIPNVEFVK
ncbi:MAG: PIN domain-containing protein [Nanoarchaeota archaeon]